MTGRRAELAAPQGYVHGKARKTFRRLTRWPRYCSLPVCTNSALTVTVSGFWPVARNAKSLKVLVSVEEVARGREKVGDREHSERKQREGPLIACRWVGGLGFRAAGGHLG